MTARTIDLRVFVFIGFPFKCVLEVGEIKTPAKRQRGRKSFGRAIHHLLLVVPRQAKPCTKFNRKQEEKVRKSIK
jgi:hypothetical protein